MFVGRRPGRRRLIRLRLRPGHDKGSYEETNHGIAAGDGEIAEFRSEFPHKSGRGRGCCKTQRDEEGKDDQGTIHSLTDRIVDRGLCAMKQSVQHGLPSFFVELGRDDAEAGQRARPQDFHSAPMAMPARAASASVVIG